jgi:hypothetical protein
VKRIPFSLTHIPDAREIAFDIRESVTMTPAQASASTKLRLRSLQAGAYFETIPAQK